MVETSLLADQLKLLRLTPADLVAIGAGLTAAAVAAIAAKEALRRVNKTEEERIAAAEAAAHEAQAVVDSMDKMIGTVLTGASSITKEALMVGSVLPDKV